MSRQYWSETIAWATADGTAIANSTTETIIFPDVTIPANYLQDGRSLRVTAFGKYSNTATPTIKFSIRLGGVSGTLLCTTPTITTPSGVSTVPWMLTVIMTVRSNGSAGTIMANGIVHVFSGSAPTVASATGAPGTAPMTAGGATAPATASLDFTSNQNLSVTATWGTASSSNTLTGLNEIVESLN